MSYQCRLVLATVFVLTAGLRAVTAQTVIVLNAPPAATTEVTLNGGATLSAKADGYGDARVSIPSLGRDTEVQIHTDVCGNTVKVFINEPGQPPVGPDTGCTRKDMWGVYIMRSVTTFVIEITGADSAVFVAQGPPPSAWLQHGAGGRQSRTSWGEPGRGLALSIGGGISSFGATLDALCGNATTCESSGEALALHAGAEYWLSKYVAATISYFRPGDITANGSGTGYHFDTTRVTRVLTIGGKVGGVTGPARIYGLGGASRHEATLSTSQTIDDKTVTVDGVAQTIKGGTQDFAQKFSGWSWMAGGGFELWATKFVGVYAEVTRVTLSGTPVAGGEGKIDEHGLFVIGGFRVRFRP